jgi:hypothetical protein
LDVVKIDVLPYLVVDCGISAVGIALFAEVRCLRSMSDDIARKQTSQLFSKSDQPSFADTIVHCRVVLIVDVGSIKMVV